MKLLMTLASLAAFYSVSIFAAEHPRIKLNYSYKTVNPPQLITGSDTVALPDPDPSSLRTTSDVAIERTLFLVKLGKSLQHHLKEFETKPCRPMGPIAEPPLRPHPPIEVRYDCSEKHRVGDGLRTELTKLNVSLSVLAGLVATNDLVGVMRLSEKLADNMKAFKGPRPLGPLPRPPVIRSPSAPGMPPFPPAAAPSFTGGLTVTTGGAQNFAYFKKVVESGLVPPAASFTLDGFLKDFDLSLTGTICDQLICPHAAVAVDEGLHKLFVQIAMNSSVTAESFHRRPLNLAIVLDISGSMSATDNTAKTRLEWAKEALKKTVENLNEGDVLSIALFETNARMLLPPEKVTNKDRIFDMLTAIQTEGTTNLEAGLRMGYESAAKNLSPFYENRVILISDAGLNTGVVNEDEILNLVNKWAVREVGLTAIGMGDNFKQKFINHIAQSKGGNYLFVQSGEEMQQYFDAFKFLVTPIATDLALAIDVKNAKFVAAYGVPYRQGEEIKSILDIKTLFFTASGGGAILLEYDLPAEPI
jgi:Ca-activated chloride channel family protein